MESILSVLNDIALPAGTVAVMLFGFRISGELGALRAQMNGMEKRFDDRLAKVDEDVKNIRADMQDIRADIRDVRNSIAGLDDRLRRIETAS